MSPFIKDFVLEKPDRQRLEWLYDYNRRATLSGLVLLLVTFTALSLVDRFYYASDYYANLPQPMPTPFGLDGQLRLLILPFTNLSAIFYLKFCHKRSTKRLVNTTLLVLTLTMSSLITTNLVQDYYNANDYTWEIAALIVFTLTMFGMPFRTSFYLSTMMLLSGIFFLVVDHVEEKVFIYDLTFLIGVYIAMIVGAYRKAELRRENFKSFKLLQNSAQELDQQANKLAQRNHELQQFAYASSHDLQEPLRTISNFVAILEKRLNDQLSEDLKLYMGFISKSTERMKHLIQAILEYSHIGRNLNLEEIQCSRTLEQVVSDLNYSIQQSNAQILVGELPNILGYSTEFSMLMQNLIGNGIKFRKKDVTPIIQVLAKVEEHEFHFSVTDNGIGIAPEYQEKVFALFGRLHTKEEYEGTGIGLAHCKKIVDIHQGRVWVDSEPGAGTTFHFTISKNLKTNNP